MTLPKPSVIHHLSPWAIPFPILPGGRHPDIVHVSFCPELRLERALQGPWQEFTPLHTSTSGAHYLPTQPPAFRSSDVTTPQQTEGVSVFLSFSPHSPFTLSFLEVKVITFVCRTPQPLSHSHQDILSDFMLSIQHFVILSRLTHTGHNQRAHKHTHTLTTD